MYLLPIFLTLISFVLSFFFGRLFNNYYVGLLNSVCVFISFIISLFIFYEIAICQSNVIINCGEWITIGILEVKWLFFYDSLTAAMLIVILGISTCAHFYSIEYMLSDPNQIKFMSYLTLFTFFMLLLVTSSNFIILFVGWEGVGICSYLLINFWHTRLSANKSAIMAMFVNKIGDISMLLSISFIYLTFHSFDISTFILTLSSFMLELSDGMYVGYFQEKYYLNGYTNDYIDMDNLYFLLNCIGIFFIIGAVGKSAQLGLHTWLPEAMEGPTPVSSLIHAATTVTAGIFLIIRTNILFQISNSLLIIIIALGSLTAFVGASIGIFQLDIKKIIAYSTCSQLGYMFLSCGLYGYNFSIYHLINHAFFKALLFLVAGYIIHAISNEQDIRKFGGLLIILPFSNIGVLIGSLSLLGFPFFSGFFSKEKIIELYYNVLYLNSSIISINYLLFFQLLTNIAVIFTILYSIKVLVYVYYYNFQNNKKALLSLHYSSKYTILPLFILSILSITSGYLLEDMMVGISTDLWNTSILHVLQTSNIRTNANINYFEFNLLSSKLPIYSIIYLCMFFIYLFYSKKYLLYCIKLYSLLFNNIYLYLNKKYLFINKNIYYFVIDFFYNLSFKSMYSLFDKGIIEWAGPYGLAHYINKIIIINSRNQTGLVYHYFGLVVLSIIIFTVYLLNLS
jgi:NADH-ubiquinone oxidoreductase chain 5